MFYVYWCMERLIKIVTSFLEDKKLKLEEDLQTLINSNQMVDEKLVMIDKILSEMVLIDKKIEKWESLINDSK